MSWAFSCIKKFVLVFNTIWSVLPGMRPMGPMAGPPMGAPAMPARPMGSALPARMPSK